MQDALSILVPKFLDLENTLSFVSTLQNISHFDCYKIDFSQIEWVEPYALLYLAHELRRLNNHRCHAKFQIINYEEGRANIYASHMGFFRLIGIDFGKQTGDIVENLYFIPIRVLRVDSVKQSAENKQTAIGDELQSYSKTLANILVQKTSGALVENLEYSLREMLRNVVEHSQAKNIYFCAQYWPDLSRVEVAILDSGIGIRKSLDDNPYLHMSSDRDALYFSLLPGISSKMYKGKLSDPYDVWQNSGYGLFMTSELCRNGGNFFICSNTAGVLLTEQEKKDYDTGMQGTAVRLIINTKNISEISKSLKQYREKGFKISKEIYGANINASTASTMLIR